ncbi:MAG: hypothetical protein KGO03_04910 [Gemmatimonadota bacterium]|nr:hypothetical protein [Gemmatimonadota bacterium]
MSARRLLRRCAVALACAAALLALPAPARAQGGMPDMSKAPADVQAIWKKVMSGGIPSQAEAARLQSWMESNKDAIVKAAMGHADTVKKAVGGPTIGVKGAAQHDCPKKVAIPASLALTPAPGTTAALLQGIKKTYNAKLTPDGAKLVQRVMAKAADAGQLNVAAGTLLMNGWVASAVVVYLGEIAEAKAGAAGPAWGDLGAALIAAGDPLGAIPVLRQAIVLGGRTAPIVTDLGVAYADLGDIPTAQTLLTEATRTDPRWSQAWDALGRVESCAGNKIPAARALGKAQETDWSADRQKDIDRLNQGQPEDEAAEAAEDLPMPPGPSPFPPPPAGGSPEYFAANSPKLGSTWEEQRDLGGYQVRMEVAFAGMVRQIMTERQPRRQSPQSGPGGGTGGMVVIVPVDNDRQALDGTAQVLHRTGVKMKMMMDAKLHADSLALADAASRSEPVEGARRRCDDAARSSDAHERCRSAYCKAMTSITDNLFAARRAAGATLVGGVEGLSAKFSKAMNAWFDWAGDPSARRGIDRQRRSELASLLEQSYGLAAGVQAAPPEECQGLPDPAARKANAKADAARDAGECKKVSIHIPLFAHMDADCHEMKMTADILGDLFGGATPTLEISRASGGKNGKFFLGLTQDVGGGNALAGWSASAGAGLQVTWDNQGWVQSSGGVLRGEVGAGDQIPGVAEASAHVSGDLLVSGRSSGPAVSGSATAGYSASAGGISYAPSVSFGG